MFVVLEAVETLQITKDDCGQEGSFESMVGVVQDSRSHYLSQMFSDE